MDVAEDTRLRSLIDSMVMAKIDVHIERLLETVRLLKARRNKLTHITVLPDDILLDIFLRLPAHLLPMTPLQRRYAPPSNADRMHVSHVCQRWRGLALSSAAMWTEPSFNVHPAFTAEMLRRAGKAPLVLFIADPYNPRPSLMTTDAREVVLKAFQKAEQLKEITLVCDQPLLEKITPFTLGKLPLLERLRISVDNSQESRLTIDDVLGNAPRLRVLVTRELAIYGASPLLANLTELVVDIAARPSWGNRAVHTPPRRPTVAEMHALLLHATFLRVLNLVDGLPTLDATYDTCTSFPDLPNLISLTLSEFLDPLTAFLVRFVAPNLEKRHFNVTLPWERGQGPVPGAQHLEVSGAMRLTDALARHLVLCPTPLYQQATLLSPDTIIEAWKTTPASGVAAFRLEVDCPCSGMALTEHSTVGQNILQLPVFRGITALTYLPESAYFPQWTAHVDFRPMQDTHPALRSLQLGSYTLPYVASLAPMRSRGVPGDIWPVLRSIRPAGEYIPFPQLETLVLENYTRGIEVLSDEHQAIVSGVLAERRAIGKPIKTLKLHGVATARPSEESLEKWKGEAREVVFELARQKSSFDHMHIH